MNAHCLIGHSENKITRNQGSLKTRSDMQCSSPVSAGRIQKAQTKCRSSCPCCVNFADCVFLESWTGALQVQPRCDGFIFGILCSVASLVLLPISLIRAPI